MTEREKAVLKYVLERNHLAFTQYFYKIRYGTPFVVKPFHRVLCNAIDMVFTGRIKRLLINIPPSHGKTEIAIINLVARGLALNPTARFIHTSYSDMLTRNNSTYIKDLLSVPEYSSFWDTQIRQDVNSKKLWQTKSGGMLYSTSHLGALTGFRAGRKGSPLGGMLLIDDPLKVSDSHSTLLRERAVNVYNSTLVSRLDDNDVPVIIIMQRVHQDDLSGYLLKGGSGDYWNHLLLPVEINDETRNYPSEYTHGIPIEYDLPDGLLWPEMEGERPSNLKESNPYTYHSQYLQNPIQLGGAIFKTEWWRYYNELPQLDYVIITGDTAQKTGEKNDFSVFQAWGKAGNNIYLLDQVKGKWQAPELKKALIAFYNKHHRPGATTGRLRQVFVEDKSSGTGLIQDIIKTESIPIKGIPRHRDKVTRSMDTTPYIEAGRVWLPEPTRDNPISWLSEFLYEFEGFSPETTGHDDQVDALMDAVDLLLGKGIEANTAFTIRKKHRNR